MIFCRGSGKVREFCLAGVSQDLSLNLRHIFVRHDPCRDFFPPFSSDFSGMCPEVRESQGKLP